MVATKFVYNYIANSRKIVPTQNADTISIITYSSHSTEYHLWIKSYCIIININSMHLAAERRLNKIL